MKTLYHGSPVRIGALEPHAARGVGPEHDRLTAIYASDQRDFAIAFALQPPTGSFGWELDFQKGAAPRIRYTSGGPNAGGTGYLYLLPSDRFEQVSEHQWVSRQPVTPLACEEIRVDDYLHWVEASS